MAKKNNELNWLDMVPAPKEGLGTVINDDGLASIVMPRFNKAWMAKIFLPKNKKNEVRVNLEINGTRIWKLIDGKRNVRTIIDEILPLVPEEEKYAERVILFLQSLYSNGFIRIES